MNENNNKIFSRRTFLKALGLGGATMAAGSVVSCATGDNDSQDQQLGEMTMRTNPKDGNKISILGYGMMRLPMLEVEGASEEEKQNAEIDQEMVNKLVDHALEHGVNYFDTSPAYCKGRSEHATGIALSRHKREEYLIATKLSNFAPETWTHEAGVEMFQNSLKELQVDYIDYLLLHAVGGGSDKDDAMKTFNARYIDNGMLDYLLEQREKGVIKNLGFSYHGNIEVYDYLLSQHDKYKWDFVQIQLNYFDWQNAAVNDEDNAQYLYDELVKRNIPAVIMEPLLGGRLAKLPDPLANKLLARDPEASVASWAFRYAGTLPGVLTVLSGMTFMEHLQDNLKTYSPLKPLSEEEQHFLEEIGTEMANYNTVPCTGCKYCMPCPYGIDIPAIFTHYNKCLNEGNAPQNSNSSTYARERRAFLVGYDRSVPRLRQADHCIGCGQCAPHCPQSIAIPKELQRISDYVEKLKREG